MPRQLKLTIIGAGSTYTPELMDGLIRYRQELPFAEVFLMDIDPFKLEVVGGLARRMFERSGMQAQIVLSGDLEAAIRDADFVICQIRVGKLEARIRDEKIPLKYDLIGQETTGAGGFMKAMRTIPEMLRIVEAMERLAPEAWLINFTNPSGLIAEVLLNHCRVKAIGLCNGPINMKRHALQRVPEARAEEVAIEYVGLNHLSWVTGITWQGRNILQEQLAGSQYRPANLPPIGFDDELLKAINAVPCGYLTYYYYRDKTLAHLKETPKSRGEVCQEIEEELLKLYQDPGLVEKPAVLDKRGGHLYSEAAISVVSAIFNDKQEEHVVNIANQGALRFMGDRDVVELNCRVGKDGARPLPLPHFDNPHITGLMQTLKSYEKLAARAGLTGDYALALQALLNHPLVGDYHRAKGVLEEMLAANRPFLPQFFT